MVRGVIHNIGPGRGSVVPHRDFPGGLVAFSSGSPLRRRSGIFQRIGSMLHWGLRPSTGRSRGEGYRAWKQG